MAGTYPGPDVLGQLVDVPGLLLLLTLVDVPGLLLLLPKPLLLPVLLVAQRAVDGGELAQLRALVLVLLLVHGHQQLLHHDRRRVHVVVGVALDQNVELVVLA
eukprot:7708650-Pyramimonas_sp.AAC.1